MIDNPKISIITATYNSSKTIADTIKSVIEQTYDNIEYIIIDGASKDNTIEIVKSFEHILGDKLKYISEPDYGIYDAMNKGIRTATGDIIGILNSDDFFTNNNIIETVANHLNDNDTDAVYGDIHFVNASNLNKCTRYYSSKGFKPWKLRIGIMPAHPSFYIRKETMKIAGEYKTDYKIGADYEMMVRLFLKMKIQAKYIPLDFVTMRTGGASTNGLKSKITLISENVRACKENNIYTNSILICIKFITKIFEFKLF